MNSMGPVDYLVVEFPDARVTGDALARLVDLVDQRVVRILDLVFLRKEPDGSVVGMEIADVDGDGELDLLVLEGATSGLIGSEDLDEAAAVIEPGSAAAVVIYENVWAIPFATALRRAVQSWSPAGGSRWPRCSIRSTPSEAGEPVDA